MAGGNNSAGEGGDGRGGDRCRGKPQELAWVKLQLSAANRLRVGDAEISRIGHVFVWGVFVCVRRPYYNCLRRDNEATPIVIQVKNSIKPILGNRDSPITTSFSSRASQGTHIHNGTSPTYLLALFSRNSPGVSFSSPSVFLSLVAKTQLNHYRWVHECVYIYIYIHMYIYDNRSRCPLGHRLRLS